jgi:glycosyltransferase involved in cell wall biosynthesis
MHSSNPPGPAIAGRGATVRGPGQGPGETAIVVPEQVTLANLERFPVKVTLVTCWFANSYGLYSSALRRALESRVGGEVDVVASNCGCHDPSEIKREFQDARCDFFVLPNLGYWKSENQVKYRLRNAARQVLYRTRAKRYLTHARGTEVMHFQQTLNATGFATLFNWLQLPSDAARVVTVHELDPQQLDQPERNEAYNLADRVIVHTEEMKADLVKLGVHAELIDVIPQGVEIGPLPDGPRSGILYYGGHRLTGTKGFDTLLDAMVKVRARLGDATPTLTIYGYYGLTAPDFAVSMVAERGLTDVVRWRNWLQLPDAVQEFARAQMLVVPFTGSFAGLPAGLALANGVPVIGTRTAGLPEHLGPLGVWIEQNDADGLAAQIVRLLNDPAERARLAKAGRERAERVLSMDVVAEQTLASYRKALEHQREGTAAVAVTN